MYKHYSINIIVQELLRHDQVVFIERWSLDTSGLYICLGQVSLYYSRGVCRVINPPGYVCLTIAISGHCYDVRQARVNQSTLQRYTVAKHTHTADNHDTNISSKRSETVSMY